MAAARLWYLMMFEPGVRTSVERVVQETDTAQTLASGEVAVLATSRIVAWCEHVSLIALAPKLRPDYTTVAMRVNIDHLRPVAVGVTVQVEATLDRVEGRRYIFAVSVFDENKRLVAEGVIMRVLVETEAFLRRANDN